METLPNSTPHSGLVVVPWPHKKQGSGLVYHDSNAPKQPITSATGFLTSPSPGINFNFVTGAYLVCSLILGVLAALDKYFGVEAVEGSWIIFAPFLPCLLWALVMRAKWLRTRGSSGSDSGGDGVADGAKMKGD